MFFINVYVLLDPDDTLSFVTPLVAREFNLLLDVLMEPFSITTLLGDSYVARIVFKNCPISFPNRVTLVDLVELDMIDFYVIFEMDWLPSCYSSMYCRTRESSSISQMNQS